MFYCEKATGILDLTFAAVERIIVTYLIVWRACMKLLLIPLLLLCVSGCSYMQIPNQSRLGYKSYDPCIRCGEKWGTPLAITPLSPNAQQQRPIQ